MKLIPVNEIPKKSTTKKRLQSLIEEFVDSTDTMVRIDFTPDDYKSATVCCSCMRIAIKRSGRPIGATLRSGKVYLYKILQQEGK